VILLINIHVYDITFILQVNHVLNGREKNKESDIFVIVSFQWLRCTLFVPFCFITLFLSMYLAFLEFERY